MFTVQAVARALGHDPDMLLELCDSYLLDHDERPGLLADIGFVEIPGVAAAQRPYLYRFVYAHLWHHWRKYGVSDRQRALYQGRLAEALELVHHGATDQVAARLAALFEAGGQPLRAAPYRRRVKQAADLVVTLWQIGLLEQHARDDFDRYRLYELRIQVSRQLYRAGRYAEGFAQASAALVQVETWQDNLRIARAANLAGMNLQAQGDYAAACLLYERTLAIRREVVGERHPDTATSLNNLGALLHTQGNLTGARPLFERALAICEQTLGPDHPHTRTVRQNLTALDD